MIQESWEAVTPQYTHFNEIIEDVIGITPSSFINVQPRLNEALNCFVSLQGFNKLLVVNGPDNSVYRQLIANTITHKTKLSAIATDSIDEKVLLGSYRADSKGEIEFFNPGFLQSEENSYVVISANLLLANPTCWLQLKSALLGQTISPLNLDLKKPITTSLDYHFKGKIIVLGDRDQLSELEYLESELHTGLSLFSEIETEIALNNRTISSYLAFLNWLTKYYNLPSLSSEAIHRLMIAGARHTEDQNYMPLDILWYRALFEEARVVCSSDKLDFHTLDKAIDQRYYRESYLPERALSDIFDGQVVIETEGECVGQVNGLTVIDLPGHPLSYGEPARISCVIHFGDGDISDVERKAELGGNLHAKGMMIMQAFVSSALNLDEPLPYSASVVFEQSYCEVDGDSASLAELCSFVSALSEYPINQQIAVTGAVDQFGRVQAVGGLNEKIEGFYHVCKHQGFTGNQGVILPNSNLKNLALHKDVAESIKKGEFHIWSVSNVDEAIPIIMDKPFRGDDESSVIAKIAQRIENFAAHEQPQGIVDRIKNWFV
ncbi:S16 family serine protease [Vibrio sp. TRT 21S02]|uniref:S16 family serine protease n=1 Tax=Vibrio sp. TRT 21S02 TaxID=3418507 RepID=UPI003CF3BFB2